MTVQEIIDKVESNEKLLEVKYKGFMVWPTIRFLVLQSIIDAVFQIDSNKKNETKNFVTTFLNIVWAYMNSPLKVKKYDILFFTTTTSNVKLNNGYYFNRISDYLAEESNLSNTIVEEPLGFFHRRPRHKRRVSSKLPFLIYAKIRSVFCLLNASKKKEVEQSIDKIAEQILSSLALKEDVGFYKNAIYQHQNTLCSLIINIDFFYAYYKKMLQQQCTSLVIVEDGYYGLDKALLIKAAQDLELTVFEPQHGFLNEAHPAYSFGKGVMFNEDFKKYLPNILLTYGDFWSQSAHVPNTVISMGNPHLSCLKDEYSYISEGKNILVVGSGVSVEETIELLLLLVVEAEKRGYRLIYRPHPLELVNIPMYKMRVGAKLIIDKYDLYKSIQSAEIIIGESSTVTFEALAFNKNVKLFLSSYTKTYLTHNVKFIDSFDIQNINKIFNNSKSSIEASSYYWKYDWKNKFAELIGEYAKKR